MRTLSLLALLAVLTPAPAFAESTPPAGKPPAKAKFDPATVITVSGTVLGEQRVDHGKGPKAVRRRNRLIRAANSSARGGLRRSLRRPTT